MNWFRKCLWQNAIYIHDKVSGKKVGIEEKFLNVIKNIYKKSTANIILNGDRVNAFPQDREQGKRSALNSNSTK